MRIRLRLKLRNALAETWNWNFAGAPNVKVRRDVITRLRQEIAARSADREFGGLLLGSMAKPQNAVEIHDFICLPSVVTEDGSYQLDSERLRAHLTSGVVGFFRSGSSDLREQELDLVKRHFDNPANLVLLIQPERNIGGFFFWLGDIFTPFSFKDFSLDLWSLEPGKLGLPVRGPVGAQPARAM